MENVLSRIRQTASLRSFINLEEQQRIFGQGRNRNLILLIGCVLIPIWQYFFYLNTSNLDKEYRLRASSGFHHEFRFVYFYYYLGLYPVAITPEDEHLLAYSKEGAKKLLAEHPDSLRTELDHTIRYGDMGKMFLFLPIALLRGSPEVLSAKPTNIALFISALIAVFAAFCWIRQPVLGILTVLLAGSNPFQLYEVYYNWNAFSWPVSVALIMLAFHLPLLAEGKRSKYYLGVLPVLTGILLATVRQVRTEPATIIIAAAASYLVISGIRWRVKTAMLLLLLVSFVGAGYAWKGYFDYKTEEAGQAVKSAGGQPYNGPRDLHHMIWHSIWCGLGDFDTKYGHSWDDKIAAKYALPILRGKYNVDVPPDGSSKWANNYCLYEYWDNGRKYYKTIYEMPYYMEVVRAKVIHDITNDPVWYLGILARRIKSVILQTTPVRLAFGGWWLDLPIRGIILLPVLGILIYAGSWMLLKLVCFTLPLAATAILIYSGRGTTFYSCYHIIAAAIIAAWLVEGGLRWHKARRGGV